MINLNNFLLEYKASTVYIFDIQFSNLTFFIEMKIALALKFALYIELQKKQQKAKVTLLGSGGKSIAMRIISVFLWFYH